MEANCKGNKRVRSVEKMPQKNSDRNMQKMLCKISKFHQKMPVYGTPLPPWEKKKKQPKKKKKKKKHCNFFFFPYSYVLGAEKGNEGWSY